MWKNKGNYKNIKDVFEVYQIKGRNIDLLLNRLAKKGIAINNAKKISQNSLIIHIKIGDVEKFFAIINEMCYTKRKIKTIGKGYPLLFLLRNMGLTIGAIVFMLLSVFVNDIIFSFSFTGSGSVYSNQVEQYLYHNGIKPFAKFSWFDLSELADDIIQNNPQILFAQCEKRGNRLNIQLICKEQDKHILGNSEKLISNVKGIIEDIKVYRGTAVVSVGDRVEEGSILVDGYVIIKEQEVKVNVIASASIKVEFNYTYVSEKDNEEEMASLQAQFHCDREDCEVQKIDKTFQNGKYIYKVNITYSSIVWTG